MCFVSRGGTNKESSCRVCKLESRAGRVGPMLIGKTPQYFQLCVEEMQIGGQAIDQQFLELSNQEDVTLISKMAQ